MMRVDLQVEQDGTRWLVSPQYPEHKVRLSGGEIISAWRGAMKIFQAKICAVHEADITAELTERLAMLAVSEAGMEG